MFKNKKLAFLLVLGIALLLLTACATQGEAGPQGPAGPQGEPGPQGEQGPAGASITAADLTCTECHSDVTAITGKELQWEESVHGSGEAYVRGASADCAGCHSGSAFSVRVAAGLMANEVEVGDPNPTRQDCRTCHQIHTTYTGEDWALETTDPVTLYAVEGVTYDGGEGNLCVNCHQARTGMSEATDGMVNVSSTHWGPHHGPQAALMIGVGGEGVEGAPSAHYKLVDNTCVTCHMGEGANHTFEPSTAACQECHEGLENFDYNGVQTEVAALADELGSALVAKGLLSADGHPVPGNYPVEQAQALWNYIYVVEEDKSMGVHNSTYATELLQYSIDILK